VPGDPLEPVTASPARPPTQRRGDGPLARGHLAGDHKRAQAHQQSIFFIDEFGLYPLPSVVRTYAPVGQTPILREWWTRDHLSAISAISPEGKLYCHSQDHAIDSADGIVFLEHLRREVSGRMVIIWDGAPIHRRHRPKEFLAHGAAQRLHLERLPADAPELNPDDGIWQQLKGVELRNICCFYLPPLHRARREAVTHVQWKPRIIQGCSTVRGFSSLCTGQYLTPASTVPLVCARPGGRAAG
jgi:transposase